jgi:hypothetical protein
LVCYGQTIPQGYSATTLGSDCNDSNPLAWQTGLFWVDADGDGVCDNAGTGNGKQTNFVDADGDGVCDNAGNPIKQQLRDGTGAGNGNKAGMKKRGNK